MLVICLCGEPMLLQTSLLDSSSANGTHSSFLTPTM